MRLSAPFLPRTLRARLVVAFCLVVAMALGLVLAALPRLLDGYFARQEQQNLQTRADVVSALVAQRLVRELDLESTAPQPIILPTEPLRASPFLERALGNPAFLRDVTGLVAQADVQITVAADPAHAEQILYTLTAPLSDRVAASGQRREPLSSRPKPFTVRDTFWSQFGLVAPQRLVTVVLSNPFTLRAQTLETILGVLFTAAALALVVAVVASLLLANRLTVPIRRLTQASRALAEGRLDARVPASQTGTPEVAELAAAFNRMADRLQGSIEYVRRDRDRSRDFLADVSHELRTPIAALRTFNELLRDGADADSATRHEFLEQSAGQIERLDWLAANLLDLSKLESGLIRLDLRPDDLRAVVEDAVEQAQPGAARRGVMLGMYLPPEPIHLPHDPQRMGQVLSNLIGNAVKFTPRGGRVEVHLEPDREGAMIRVADTGVGIDASELPHVFERFYRGSQAHEVRAGGSGLGLSIARSLVEMHGGRIGIESTLGRGTEVRVILPSEVSVSSPTAAPA